jgi:hypothetical protein
MIKYFKYVGENHITFFAENSEVRAYVGTDNTFGIILLSDINTPLKTNPYRLYTESDEVEFDQAFKVFSEKIKNLELFNNIINDTRN